MSKSMVGMPVVALRGMTVLPKMLVHFDIIKTHLNSV